MKNIFYIFILFLLTNFIFGQTVDSGHNDNIDSLSKRFKLKKFKIGLELGMSPVTKIFGYNPPGLVKKYPFYEFDIGYNQKIADNLYFIISIGLAYEESFNLVNNSYPTEFTYTETINTNTVSMTGTKTDHYSTFYHDKSVYSVFNFGLQKFWSPFKNKRFKLSCQLGITIKPLVWHETVNNGSHYKDSVTMSQTTILNSSHYDYSNTSTKIKLTHPVDYMLSLCPGLLYDQGTFQHQIGLSFSLGVANRWTGDGVYSGGFIRLFYSLSF